MRILRFVRILHWRAVKVFPDGLLDYAPGVRGDDLAFDILTVVSLDGELT